MDDSNGLKYARLGDVGVLLMGNSPPGETYNDGGDGLPLINGPAEYGPRHPRPVKWTTAPSRICKPGDILVCVRGNTTGRLCVADAEYCIGRGVAALRGKEKTYLTPFLEFVLRYRQDEILEQATGGGSTFPNINKPQLEDLEVPLPTLEEQQAIAYVLRTVQRAKEATEKVIAAARQLKQSLMRHLFTYGPVPVEQADKVPLMEMEGGLFPEHWSQKQIGDLTTLVGSGITPRGGSKTYLQQGVPLIRSQNVLMNQLDLSDVAFITEETHNSMARSALQPSDVLLNITGASIGRTAVVPPDLKMANVNQHVCRMRFVGTCNSHFVSYYLASERGQEQVFGNQHGATRQGLNYAQVRAMWLPCPSKDEQDEIASVMLSVEQKLASEKCRKLALEVLFNTLLHDLMTGKVRVNELQFPAMKEGSP